MSIASRYLHTFVVKRMSATTSGSAETVGGLSTTLSADTAVGATSITVGAVGALAPGHFVRVGDTGETEYRTVATVAAPAITLTTPLQAAHDSGDAVRQVDGLGAVTVDDYGQPVVAEVTVATVPGLLQPRSAREVLLASQSGAVVGSHVGYMDPLATLGTDCWIEVDGDRYDVVSIADAGGVGHHYEVGLRSVA